MPAVQASPWRVAALAAVIVVAGACAYTTSFAGGFVFDDFPAIVDNQALRTVWPPWRAMVVAPDLTLSGRPVASLSFAINHALADAGTRDRSARRRDRRATDYELPTTDLFGYHFLNLAIHLAAALALFGVVRRTLLGDRVRLLAGSPATGLAFATSLVWVVHPLQTESVTYLVQRVESLMGLFVLLALYCAIRAAGARRSRLWTAGAIASCALGIATKEVAATAPVLIGLWDWVFLARSTTDGGNAMAVWRRRWPLYAGLGATWLLLPFIVPGARPHSVGFGLEGWTAWTYLLTESGVLLHYLRLALWPSPLVLDPYWPMVHSFASVAWPATALLGLLILTAIGAWRRHPLGFAGAWCFVILAPTSSVVPIVTEVAAEHRMYLPLAAIAAAAVTSVFLAGRFLLARLPLDRPGRQRAGRASAVLALSAVAMVLGLGTRARNLDYASDERIWRDTIGKQPDNPRARTALGADLLAARRYGDAEVELQTALRLDPRNPVALSNLGIAEAGLGRIDAAIRHLEQAVTLRPEYLDAHLNLAEAYAARHQDALAARHFPPILAARPDDVRVLTHFGLILAASSDDAVRNGATALELADHAVRLTSRRDVASLTTLAAALAELDRFDEAVSALREAIALSADNPERVAEFERRLAIYAAHQKVRRPGPA